MLKKSLKLLLLGLSVAVTSSLLSFSLFGQVKPDLVPNIPLSYTIVAWDSVSLAQDDFSRSESLRTGARRADGSTAMSIVVRDPDGTSFERRTIFDMAKERHMMLDSVAGSITTTRLSPESVEVRRKGTPACSGRVVGNRLGYDVILVTEESPVPIEAIARFGEMKSEQYVAPDLGCLIMETRVVMSYRDGSERVIRSERVVDVSLGEPDPSLFSVPESYEEMSPAERMISLGKGAELANDTLVQQFEANYQALRVSP